MFCPASSRFGLFRFGLAASLAFAASPSDLPVADWIERARDLDNLVLEYEVLSAGGDEASLRFTYEAPDRCHITFDGGSRVQQWIDGGVMSVRAGEGAEAMHYTLDLEEIFEPSAAWLREFETRVPRAEPATPRTPGPLFLIWPDTNDDSVLFKFEYTTNSPSMFAWLPMLRNGEFDVSCAEAEGFILDYGDGLRIQLEPEHGIPRSASMGTGEDAREAMRLVNMVVDGPTAPEFSVPDPAAGSTDRSPEMAVQIRRASWASSRASAHTWLWNRIDKDGLEVSDADLAEIVDLFAAHYTAVSSSFFEQRLEMERKRIDDMIDRVLAARGDPAKRDEVGPVIQDLKLNGTKKYRQGLGKLTDAFLEQIEPVQIDGADEEHVLGAVDLERQGASQFLEEFFVAKVLAHLAQRIEDLG